MAPKYKNDLAKCYALLKLDYNWKATCEDLATFVKALSDITAQLISASKSRESIQPISPDVSPDSLMKSIETFLIAYVFVYDLYASGVFPKEMFVDMFPEFRYVFKLQTKRIRGAT
ncbi:hypothetical protein AHF37_08527 [Paragonimus kellicotti]|nr:hypothetical protein AHF37_08527 [Paragonimus kellicotti]